MIQDDILRNSRLPYREASIDSVPGQNELKIIFSDAVRIYPLDLIQKLHAVASILIMPNERESSSKERTERTIAWKHYNSKMFEIVSNIILRNQVLTEVLSKDSRTEPFIFEEVAEAIRYAHPVEGTETLIENIKQNELPCLSLEQAKKIVEKFDAEAMQTQPNEPPELVKQARQILFLAKLFDTEQEAAIYFKDLKIYRKEVNRTQAIIHELKRLKPISTFEQLDLDSRLSYQENNLNEFKKLLEKHLALTALPRTMRQNFNLSKLRKDPIYRAEAETAFCELAEYKIKVGFAFKNCGFDLAARPDLHPYLFGPEAFLLERYKVETICTSVAGNPTYRFCYSAHPERYLPITLNHDGPRELEEEIRTVVGNVQDGSEEVRARSMEYSVKEHIYTRPIPESFKQFQSKVLSILSNWMSCQVEEVEFVKKNLLFINGWNRLGIVPSDIRIVPKEGGEAVVSDVFTGFLIKFGMKYNFKFKCDRFILLITNYEQEEISYQEYRQRGSRFAPETSENTYTAQQSFQLLQDHQRMQY